MPRYEYRDLHPLPDAEKTFLAWVERLDQEFSNRDVQHRSVVVRDALHELYLGRPYQAPAANAPPAQSSMVRTFDPRNATLEP
jgi:hypothetical protein